MRILLLNWRDPKHPQAGGAERVTIRLLNFLIQKGHEVTWFSSRFPGAEKEEKINNLKIIREGTQKTVHLKFFLKYKKYFKDQYDLIIDEINTVPFFSSLFVKEKKIALIFQLARKVWFYESPWYLAPFGYIAEPLYLRSYRHIPAFTISRSTKADLEKLGFKKIFTLPVASELPTLPSVPAKEVMPTFIYLGRLTPSKRVEEQIKAVSQLDFKFQFWIVGEGKEKYHNKLKKEVQKLNLADRIKFWGQVSEEEKKSLLSKSWVLLLTSVREGYGLVIQEAASQGTPAIVYNVPGLCDSVIHEKTGLICTKNTAENLASNLRKVVTEKNLLSSLSENTLERARKFSWEKSGEEFFNIINKL